MTNAEFLDYFEAHSKTERALFSRDQVARLFRLSGTTPSPVPADWVCVTEYVAKPLIERARRRLKFRVIKGGKR